MTTSFPTGLDALTNPTGSSSLTSPDHAGQHADINDAVEALEAKVGVDGSAVTSSLDYKITNINASNLASGTVPSARVAGAYTDVTSVGTLGSLNVSGVSSFGSEILATTSIAAGRGVGIKADPTNAQSILQFTNNAVSTQWSSLVATNNLLTTTTPFKATQFLQGTDYLSPYQGFRNKIINGNMSVWQRGTSVAINSQGYTADRWYHQSYNNATISRQATSDTSVLPNVQYCARVQRNNGATATNFMYFLQPMETQESIKVSGKTATLSFYARKGANFPSASGAFQAILYYGTGTDQNLFVSGYTGSAVAFSNTFTLTSSWVRYSITGTIPTNSTELSPLFGYTPTGTAGASDYFEITGVQLEEGSVATPLEQRPMQTELALCQRYFQKSYSLTTTPGTVTDVGNYAFYGSTSGYSTIVGTVQLKVSMRVTPTTVTYYRNDTGGIGGNWFTISSSGSATPTTIYASDSSFSFYQVTNGAYIVGGMYGHWTASAEL